MADLTPLEYLGVISAIGLLVLVGGLVAGLTIGLMSIDSTTLSILKASGTAQEKLYASRIEPIRKDGHLLLVTLLLVNTIVNETLPILFGTLQFTGYKSVMFSTVLIVIFGEIVPQAVCSRYGLLIGAFFALPVRFLIWIMAIIAYPIAKLLDWVLGHKEGVIYRHAGLKELVALHGEDQSGPLSKDEVSILRAVLDLRTKKVSDIMTKLDNVFMFSMSEKLDRKNLQKILNEGHSRIPVYFGNDRNKILGTFLVKQLLLNDPDIDTPFSAVKLRKLPRIRPDTPLFDMLHLFEVGSSHMALVADIIPEGSPTSIEESNYISLGIITLEDVIEELIGAEIIDETDVFIDMESQIRVSRSEREIEENSPNCYDSGDWEHTPLLGSFKSNPIPIINPNTGSSKQYKRTRAV